MALVYFLYARKSEESEERQILSIEAQLTELRTFAQKENLPIREEFVEAMTAKKPGRLRFNQMMARLEKGEAQGIVSWHPDRLARNSIDGGRIIYLLDTGQIKALKFPTFWFENTPQGKFMMNIAFGQSKYYIDNLSENVKRGNRQKLRNGIWPGPAPIGYLNDKVHRSIVVHPEEGPLVTKLFEVFATGENTLKNLSAVAASWGLVSRAKKSGGKPLVFSSLRLILCNPFYYGVLRYKGEYFEGKHTPLATKVLFDRVQKLLTNKYRTREVRKHHFPFLQLAACKSCGCSITAERQKGHHYYRCTRKKGPCREPFVREEVLNQQITRAIQDVALPEEGYQEMLAHLNRDKAKANQRLPQEKEMVQKPLEVVKANLNKLLDLHLQGVISQEEYWSKKEIFIKAKMDLEEKLAQLKEGGNLWLEPLAHFLEDAYRANQVSADKNLAAKREFLKKIGSNFRLTSRTLQFSYSFPWGGFKKTGPVKTWWAAQGSNLRPDD